MKVLRHIAAATALLALGTVMTGCFYWPYDDGYHRGRGYERERDYHQGRDRGDHERDRHRDRERDHERDGDYRH